MRRATCARVRVFGYRGCHHESANRINGCEHRGISREITKIECLDSFNYISALWKNVEESFSFTLIVILFNNQPTRRTYSIHNLNSTLSLNFSTYLVAISQLQFSECRPVNINIRKKFCMYCFYQNFILFLTFITILYVS